MADTLPASRVEVFDVTAPAGTTKAAPLEVPTAFNPGEVVRVEIDIPDGPNYLAGIQVALAHSPVIPRTQGAWIVGNDKNAEFATIGYPSTGAWSCFVYNTDIFPHTFHVTFHVADFALTRPEPPAALIPTPLVA